MRQRKIRGHKKILKQIEEWRLENLELNLEYVKSNERGRIDVIVHPWCDISILNSAFPEPKGLSRQKILSGLLDIYDNWKIQLENSGQPYYLKLWLFEPRFSRSQVVCALSNSLDYYKFTFHKPDYSVQLDPKKYGKLKTRISKLNWDFRLDEDCHNNSDVGEKELYASVKDFEEATRWYNHLLKRPHRIETPEQKIDDIDQLHFFKRGYVWIGG
jgi:hypothetical protein